MYGEGSRVFLVATLIDEIDWRDPRSIQKDAHKVIWRYVNMLFLMLRSLD